MKSDKIFWGILFVFVGGIFLLENFGVIDFSWHYVWRFWPVILILMGVNILFSRSNSKIGVLVTVIITVLTLGLLTFKGLQKGQEHDHWDFGFSDGVKDGWGNRDGDNNNNTDSTVNYQEAFEDGTNHAVLNIKGGAAKYILNSGTSSLFTANTRGNRRPFYVLRTEKVDRTTTVNFIAKSAKTMHFDSDESNDITMSLNPLPTWDLNLTMGAGKADFDLSVFKMQNINIKGGAAEFDIRLGDLSQLVNLTAETGIADVTIEIPTGVGCRIKTATGLSSKSFEDFIDKGDGNYETSNYNSSAKKINISFKGGLSDIKVKRY
ncbi:MAG: cell wall-active antibiotics response protein [Bacteroidetes bacterium]|nr:cell wall-active antibiotics response protein [Bacteroidota bacterium]MBU1485168.1 cell wall-active antibiotics response protein [Bacteroidota bacterium]MBU2045526.1 cell wall-active antibiotics response protein [Bacteroidota bacterium]MBU2266589.1 cell wall-active antibiotics response protein [Bacteroidota bacterium]MBU2376608.1 cell wall-active antibiotics response protein [Bacteroidota bacterium]